MPITILIGTHNFIDPSRAAQAGCKVQSGKPFKVMVANGERLSSSGKCVDLPVYFQGLSISTLFFFCHWVAAIWY